MTVDFVSELWAWFPTCAAQIQQDLGASEAGLRVETSISELDRRIRQINPSLRWEVGPLLDDTTFLAISPNGSKDNLLLTRKIVEAAPTVPGWRFLPAKPPKNDKRFSFEFGEARVNTKAWHYSLVRWDSPIQYGVTWIPDSEVQLDSEYFDALAWFVLTSEIGEEAAISLFEFSEIAYSETAGATEIEHFRDHFTGLRKMDAE